MPEIVSETFARVGTIAVGGKNLARAADHDGDGATLRFAVGRVLDVAEGAEEHAQAANIMAAGALTLIKEHVIRCEGAGTLLHRDMTDLRDDIQRMRVVVLRLMWYGGATLAAIMVIQILGLERAFDIFRFIRGK